MQLNKLFGFLLILLLVSYSCSKTIVSEETPRKISRLLSTERVSGLTQKSNPNNLQFEFFFEQELDHFNENSSRFKQKLRYTHRGYEKPTVIITEGYKMSDNYIAELAELIDANEIIVEHRYMGESLPEKMDVKYLNLKQACADYHTIRQFFEKVYPDNWIATGFSKGGQTAMMYRHLYPEDCKGSISYNSPLNFSTNEKRIDEFFENVETEECRSKLIAYQRAVLENKNDILPLLVDRLNRYDGTFGLSAEKILEYMVLEYPFAFWQYQKIECDDIPSANASLPLLLNHLEKVASPEFFSSPNGYEYAMYQFYTELGYYEHVMKNVQDLLMDVNYLNSNWLPRRALVDFNEDIMKRLSAWIETDGRNMIFIYGENDPWAASRVEANESLNSKTYILPKGNHSTRIKDFSSESQQEMLKQIDSWMIN